MVDKYYNNDLLETHGMYTKLLYDQEERDEFDKLCYDVCSKRDFGKFHHELKDMDYLAVFDKKHDIVGGCKLSNSKGLKYSISSIGQKFYLDVLASEYNMTDISFLKFVEEGDVYCQICKLFTVASDSTVIYVLANSLSTLFAEQGIDYAFSLANRKRIELIRVGFGQSATITKLLDKPITFGEVSDEYFLIKIEHKSNKFIRENKEAIKSAGFGLPDWASDKKR